jgi:F-type H+-transporting ATPase subunit b
MRRLLLVAILFLAAALPYPAAESASQKAEEATGVTEHGFGELFWGSINFVILAAGLGYLIKKNAGPYFAQRAIQIRKGLLEAEAVRQESDAKVAEVERRLANLKSEIEEMKSRAQEEAAADAERIRREASAEVAKIQARLTEEIAAAAKSARLELRRHSAELALSLAERKIAARMSPEIEDRLVRGFVAGLARN